jgi:hypothetical protein
MNWLRTMVRSRMLGSVWIRRQCASVLAEKSELFCGCVPFNWIGNVRPAGFSCIVRKKGVISMG